MVATAQVSTSGDSPAVRRPDALRVNMPPGAAG